MLLFCLSLEQRLDSFLLDKQAVPIPLKIICDCRLTFDKVFINYFEFVFKSKTIHFSNPFYITDCLPVLNIQAPFNDDGYL